MNVFRTILGTIIFVRLAARLGELAAAGEQTASDHATVRPDASVLLFSRFRKVLKEIFSELDGDRKSVV